jgi:hypothetical protein
LALINSHINSRSMPPLPLQPSALSLLKRWMSLRVLRQAQDKLREAISAFS